ncbi:MAG: hypothetical protein HY253_14230 [Burkholderiales bacterium]|nr:hypothetical protein [Burkholderiales bacterium]
MRFFLSALIVWMSIAQVAAEDLSSLNKIIEITKMSKVHVTLEMHDANKQELLRFCKIIIEKLGTCQMQVKGDEKKAVKATSTASGEIEGKQAHEFLSMIQKEFVDTVPGTKWESTTNFDMAQNSGKLSLKICRKGCD